MGHIMGSKDRQIWSSSHVIQAPLFDHSNMYQNSVVNHRHHHDHHSGVFHWPLGTLLREDLPLTYNSRLNQQINWQRSIIKERMQAFFLVSPGSTSSGTGVYLPPTAFGPPPRKPAFSPAILPARVVPASNLNVRKNGIYDSTRPETRGNDFKKEEEKVETPKSIEVEIPIEQLLPEEWIY